MKTQPTFAMKLAQGIHTPDGILDDGILTEALIEGITEIQVSSCGQIVYFVSESAMETAQKITHWTACNSAIPALVVETYQNEQSVNMICCHHDTQNLRQRSFYTDWVLTPEYAENCSSEKISPEAPKPNQFAFTAYCFAYLCGIAIKKVNSWFSCIKSSCLGFMNQRKQEYLMTQKKRSQ